MGDTTTIQSSFPITSWFLDQLVLRRDLPPENSDRDQGRVRRVECPG
jgi:hypothetical protein